MSPSLKLAFAAYGEPLSPVIWSGTPLNLATALEKLGVEIISLDCDPMQVPWKWNFIRRFNKFVLRHEVNYTRRRLGRKQCAELATTLPQDCAGVMHMSS